MSENLRKRISALQLLCFAAATGIVITDNMLDMWVKDPPQWLLIGCVAVALGVELQSLRAVAEKFLHAMAGQQQNKGPDK